MIQNIILHLKLTLKFKDKIQIKNVLNYDDNKEIFKNINFEIIKNSTIGLIGESGSEKVL